jgi:hypothetical protein
MKKSIPGEKKTPSTKFEGGNAFEVLMKSKKRKVIGSDGDNGGSASAASRFVPCPVGCGTHVLQSEINDHLDKCLAGNEATMLSKKQDGFERDRITSSADDTDGATPTTPISKSKMGGSPSTSQQPNVFSKMMKESRRIFSARDRPPLRSRFHLHENGELSWIDRDANAEEETKYEKEGGLTRVSSSVIRVEWSATVTLRGERLQPSNSPGGVSPGHTPRDVELLVSTSIPSDQRPNRRLVRHHSRLSVSTSTYCCDFVRLLMVLLNYVSFLLDRFLY